MSVTLNIASRHLLSWGKDYKAWVSFAVGVILCLSPSRNYIQFSKAIGTPIQVFEAYVITGSIDTRFLGILMGGILLLSDAPFTNARAPYEILRVGKCKWICGQIAYVILASILYMSVELLASSVISVISAKAYLENAWSEALTVLAERTPTYASTQFHLYWPYPEYIHSVTPMTAAILTLIFHSAYLCALGLIMLGVSIMTQRNIGWISAAVIHLIGYVIYTTGSQFISQKFSLFSCAVPAFQYTSSYDLSTLYAATVYVILLSVLIILIWQTSKRYEPF